MEVMAGDWKTGLESDECNDLFDCIPPGSFLFQRQHTTLDANRLFDLQQLFSASPFKLSGGKGYSSIGVLRCLCLFS